MNDLDMYLRGMRTAVACWTAYARTIAGGEVHRLPGVDVAVFTQGPERDVFNNAVLGLDLAAPQRGDAVDAMVRTYADSGITAYAAWVHESDAPMLDELTGRGFAHQETTWAMGRALDDSPVRDDVRVEPGAWSDYLRVLELPPGLLERADPGDFDVVVARLDDAPCATGMSFDHEGDSGIYNVATLETARRQGFGSAVVTALLAAAGTRGCRTSTLQSTEMARGVYAGQGFGDLGRILELGPPPA